MTTAVSRESVCVLVTGGDGFVGRHLQRTLEQRGRTRLESARFD
jgi:nucleoside-diphosphate-sugar epimerase